MLGRFALGVMQGRLLPKYKGRYQAHPKGRWCEEFDRAARLGLDLIEFILDYEDAEENPLMREAALADIGAAVSRTGVGVKSICADYFMEAPLHASSPEAARASRGVLETLVRNGASIGVRDVVIPCVDQSRLSDRGAEERFVVAVAPVVALAEERGVNLCLETDLPPERFCRLLAAFKSNRVTVNYDTGNSAALGFRPEEELAAYGARISDIHVKDRVRSGGPVRLGAGDADFDAVFGWLAGSAYDGPLILQACRDDEGVGIFRDQLEWLQDRYAGLLA